MNDFEAEGQYASRGKATAHTMQCDPAVDTALAEVKRLRKLVKYAKVKYPALQRKMESLAASQPECTAGGIQALKDRKELEQEMDLLSPAFHNGPDLVRNALRHLREVNGIETACYVDRSIGDLVMLRLSQGYTGVDVADMIGCTSSTVSSIKSGRYRYSERPENSSIGARSHRKRI